MNILYFASLRERLGLDQEHWPAPHPGTLRELLAALRERGEPWQSLLNDDTVLMAVNQEIASPDTAIDPEDEVAFFPPVTGG